MMPEILTESFCERCGTRYTFESVAPRKTRKLGQFKTLSKGVKNWVMSDDSSLDEAMAAARGDEEREATAQQLDAFHSTFNFCMNCRQYTCGNCWNPSEGRCLTCAPNLGAEILPAPFPNATGFEQVRLDAEAWPEVDLGATAAAEGVPDLDVLLGGNGVRHDETNGTAAGSNGVAHEELPEIDPAARLAFLSGEAPAPAWPADEVGPEADAFDGSADLIGLPEPEIMAAAPEAHEVESSAIAEIPSAPAPIEAPEPIRAADAAAEAPVHPDAPPLPEDLAGRAAAMTERTSDLLTRFRPGQNIDAELAAYEAELEAKEQVSGVSAAEAAEVAGAAAVVAGAQALTDETPAVAATDEAATEDEDDHWFSAAGLAAAAAAAATDRDVAGDRHDHKHREAVAEPIVAAEPETEAAPAVATEAEPELQPAAAAAPEPEPAAAPEPARAPEPVREDRIEQPTWRIYAPDPQNPATPTTLPQTPPAQPSIPVQASAEPQWPSRPEIDESPSMALLANRARTSSEAMWAASAREVVATPAGSVAAPVAGVQPCSNCGLSLSANARFCRRCGTRQG